MDFVNRVSGVSVSVGYGAIGDDILRCGRAHIVVSRIEVPA
jgi:hypothetical protein